MFRGPGSGVPHPGTGSKSGVLKVFPFTVSAGGGVLLKYVYQQGAETGPAYIQFSIFKFFTFLNSLTLLVTNT
jgi:hypothetical protein